MTKYRIEKKLAGSDEWIDGGWTGEDEMGVIPRLFDSEEEADASLSDYLSQRASNLEFDPSGTVYRISPEIDSKTPEKTEYTVDHFYEIDSGIPIPKTGMCFTLSFEFKDGHWVPAPHIVKYKETRSLGLKLWHGLLSVVCFWKSCESLKWKYQVPVLKEIKETKAPESEPEQVNNQINKDIGVTNEVQS